MMLRMLLIQFIFIYFFVEKSYGELYGLSRKFRKIQLVKINPKTVELSIIGKEITKYQGDDLSTSIDNKYYYVLTYNEDTDEKILIGIDLENGEVGIEMNISMYANDPDLRMIVNSRRSNLINLIGPLDSEETESRVVSVNTRTKKCEVDLNVSRKLIDNDYYVCFDGYGFLYVPFDNYASGENELVIFDMNFKKVYTTVHNATAIDTLNYNDYDKNLYGIVSIDEWKKQFVQYNTLSFHVSVISVLDGFSWLDYQYDCTLDSNVQELYCIMKEKSTNENYLITIDINSGNIVNKARCYLKDNHPICPRFIQSFW